MSKINSLTEFHKDFVLQPTQSGCRILKPHKSVKGLRLESLLQNRFNVYLFDKQERVRQANDTHTESLGFYSFKDYCGVTIFDISPHAAAKAISNNNQEVLTTKAPKFIEEHLEFGKIIWNGLTIKIPLFNQDNRIQGILGCTIVFGMHDFAKSLHQLFQLGLLNSFSTLPNYPLYTNDNVYLSNRQNEILKYLVKGKTIREIAKILGLSPRTVGHYYETIKVKFNVWTRSDLIEKVTNLV